MAYEESPGLLHVLDDKDEQLAKTVKSSKEKRRSKQLEEQVKKDELVAQDLQNRFNKRAFEESHDNAVLDELANTVKSFKEKRKSKQFEEQVKSDEQVAQDLQNLLSEMPYKESAGLHDNSVLGNEGEQFPKTVGRSLKVKGKEKILEDEQVKKDEELALVLQESLNMVEPPPRPRIEERKSIPRRAALDVKKSSKEKGKGKKSEGEQVKKDEELALILQESLNMVEPPPPPPNEEHKSISRRAAFDVQEQLAKEKGKGKQIEDEQVKKDEQLAVIVQESLNMVESPEEDSNISSSRAPMDEDEQRIIWESLKGKGLLTQPEDEPLHSVITRQVRSFSRDPFPNKLQHYLSRATLIDSIRLTLRSPPVQETDLTTLLNHRLLDSFVVKNALRSSPSLSSAWSIFKSLKKIKPQLSYEAETLHAFATVLAKFHRSSQLKSLIGLVHAGKFGRVQFSFMNLMNLYATASDFDSVLNTWDEYISSGEGKGCCTESCNIVMQVYVSLGKDADAVQTFDHMINNGGIPNSRTFTIMIEHLVKSGNLDAAMEVFETLPSMRITRTLKHYSVLVEAFVDAQRFVQVKTLLAEMKADGKFPSRRLFEPLKRMREAGFEEETGEFLREMLPDERVKDVSMYSMDDPNESEEEEPERDDAQVKLKPWLDPKALANSLKKWGSDTVTALEEANFVWTNLLVCKMLRNFRSSETAWSFFCWVAVQPGFTHDAYTIERMMAMLARNGEVELVDKLISKVRVEGIKLPFSTIRLIIDLYGVSKKPEAAIKVFRHDRTTLCGSVSGFNLMLLYSSLLRTLTKCKRNAEALEMLEEMVSTGVSPDIQTFSGLMYYFALQGEIQTVQRLFSMVRQIGLEPDPYMLKLLVQAYCRCERSVLAFRVFQDMKDMNLIPDRETKELLVRSLWREEKRKEAAAVEESSYCDEEGNSSSVLRLTLKGHVWNFSSRDIARVYNLYRDCILKTPS
ncbi:unnamed protein product [Brassica napus]|uniref:(rape) hypothetical protein n=1 Tax=Brassica napus TaxID=3708 RepID=A0A816YPG9_BRANA|nr:unnamed protein product [Brassica napus]